MFWRYRAVWLGVIIFAWVFWEYNPNLGGRVEQETPPPLTNAIKWECGEWQDVPLNGHSLKLERCTANQATRLSLYYKGETLIREWYWYGVFQAGIANRELLKKLSRPKPMTT